MELVNIDLDMDEIWCLTMLLYDLTDDGVELGVECKTAFKKFADIVNKNRGEEDGY